MSKEKSNNSFIVKAFDEIDYFIGFMICSMLLICSPYYSIFFRGIFWWLGLVWGLCILVYHLACKKDIPWKNPYFIIALVYSFTINLTCLINGAFGRYGLGYLFNAIFLLVCFLSLKSEKKGLLIISTVLIASACLYSIIDFITFALSEQDFSFRKTRIEGIWGNPNGAGMFVSIVLMFLFYLNNYTNKVWQKVLLIGAALIMGAELLLSGNRSGLLGLALAIMVIAFCCVLRLYSTGTKQQKKVLTIILVALLILLLVLLISPFGQKAYNKLFAGGTSGRGELWNSGMHYASKHLFLGDNQVEIMKNVGASALEIGYSEEEALITADISGEATVHNSFLHILLVGGLVTLIPYVVFVLSFYFKGFMTLRYLKKMDSDEFLSCIFYVAMFTCLVFMAFFETVVSSLNLVPLAYYFAYAAGINTFISIDKKYKAA